jgi:hypothetical protein
MSDVFVLKASLSLYYVKQYLEVDQIFFQPAADRLESSVFCRRQLLSNLCFPAISI